MAKHKACKSFYEFAQYCYKEGIFNRIIHVVKPKPKQAIVSGMSKRELDFSMRRNRNVGYSYKKTGNANAN